MYDIIIIIDNIKYTATQKNLLLQVNL